MTDNTQFGIYLNSQQGLVVRITSTYWIPESPEWIYVTAESNATLVEIRQIAKRNSLVDDPDAITWGRIPMKDEDKDT
ncbi:hypothetical protein FIM12_01980 [SAR202 cluster bacterium AD-804-J14_MRT_500m]|nr:hypothetical protein [SAR202 cluster bacterium AD-804-J14_MRT_500m]